MSDRDKIFGRIAQALASVKEREKLPDWEDGFVRSRETVGREALWAGFCRQFSAVHGKPLEGLDALAGFLAESGLKQGYCDPLLLERLRAHKGFAGIELEGTFDPKRRDAYGFGITRASGAIAETGSVVIADSETSSRLGALAPWVHVAMLPRSRLLRDVGEALEKLGTESAVCWITGPSKTADVEGILIEGVHGPGVQVCCLWEG